MTLSIFMVNYKISLFANAKAELTGTKKISSTVHRNGWKTVVLLLSVRSSQIHTSPFVWILNVNKEITCRERNQVVLLGRSYNTVHRGWAEEQQRAKGKEPAQGSSSPERWCKSILILDSLISRVSVCMSARHWVNSKKLGSKKVYFLV